MALCLLLLAAQCNAQFGMGKPSGPEAKAVRSDLQYIRCEVCEQLAKQAYRQVSAFKKEAAEKKMKHQRKVALPLVQLLPCFEGWQQLVLHIFIPVQRYMLVQRLGA